jgi:hypothetical protein
VTTSFKNSFLSRKGAPGGWTEEVQQLLRINCAAPPLMDHADDAAKEANRRVYRQPRQKLLKRVEDNSVKRTVCWIFLCPR